MRRPHICASDLAMASVRCEDDDGSEIRLECSVEVGEALNVEHVDLVDEEHTWHELCNAVIDVLIHHFVNLQSQLLRNLSLFGSVDLTHQR